MNKWLFLLLGAIAVLAFSSPAWALPIAPGTTITPTPPSVIPVGSTIFASQGPTAFDKVGAQSQIHGTFVEVVFTDAITGRLDFVYQVTNTGGGATPPVNSALARITSDGYTGFSPDVGQESGALTSALSPLFVIGTKASSSVDADGTGNVIGFNFDTTVPGLGPIPVGATSFVLIIKTSASTTAVNDFSAKDGVEAGSFSMGPGGVPTPEPATLVLLGGTLLGLGGATLRRRRTAKTLTV